MTLKARRPLAPDLPQPLAATLWAATPYNALSWCCVTWRQRYCTRTSGNLSACCGICVLVGIGEAPSCINTPAHYAPVGTRGGNTRWRSHAAQSQWRCIAPDGALDALDAFAEAHHPREDAVTLDILGYRMVGVI
jgi:hypothetical protein